MTNVDYSGLDELDARFADALRARPGLRRAMHAEVARALETEVRDQIVMTGIRRRTGRLEGWQQGRTGSGGGYAAVRPIGSAEGGGTGRNSEGAITNYLEHGHKTRRPTGAAKRRKRGGKRQGFARGHYFYEAARRGSQRTAFAAANRYAERMAERLGD